MERMRVESLRIKSFTEDINYNNGSNDTWKPWEDLGNYWSKEVLASKGLFYFGRPATVKCAFCTKTFSPIFWNHTDQLDVEHFHRSPNCRLILTSTDNITLRKEKPLIELPEREQIFPGAFAIRSRREYRKNVPLDYTVTYIYSRGPIWNDEMLIEENRRKTFDRKEWLLTQSSDNLALAGFCFMGPSDYIECYQCKLGLINWKPNFCPFEHHAYYSPHCTHVMFTKSEHFITAFKKRMAKRFVDILDRNIPNESFSLELDVSPSLCSDKNTGGSSDEKTDCIICCSQQRNVLFLPCRHLLMCGRCASSFNKCAYCKSPIEYFTKVYTV